MLARVALATALSWLAAHTQLHAQQLALRHYDVADGLAHSFVGAIHQDARGFLWFGTREGLSCFDGYRFLNYGVRDGLEHPIINDIAEDRQGRLWVATNGGGVARLVNEPTNRTAGRKFTSFSLSETSGANRVNALLFDAQNRLWCVTDAGLYRAALGSDTQLKFEVVVPHKEELIDMEARADSHGRLWFTLLDEVIEVVGEQIIKYSAPDFGSPYSLSLAADQQGRLLMGGAREVFEFVAPPAAPGRESERGRWQRLPLALRPEQRIRALLFDAQGALWIGTTAGLVKYHAGRQTLYTTAQGLSDSSIESLATDRDGNLWIGTNGGGVNKLAGELIVSFALTTGQTNQAVYDVIEDRAGRIYAIVGNGALVELRDGQARSVPGAAHLRVPVMLQDARGAWWVVANSCWRRVRGPELDLRRSACFNFSEAGLPATLTRSWAGWYQAPTGELWLSGPDNALFRRGAADETFERLPVTLPRQRGIEVAPWMVQDRSGALWLGTFSRLWRLKDGRLTQLEPRAGLPETDPRALFVDSRGWLWVGLRHRGVSVTKDPEAATPQFENYSTAQGLASDTVWTIAEDDFGRIYFGTGKGLDQLDPATGRIRHFNSRDGLAGDVINRCLKDRRGDLWVATSRGLSRFNPRAERPAEAPPPIYLKRISLAGEDWPLAETGATLVPEARLPAARNNLLIEYVALSFRSEEQLKYQYRLEGLDADWSAPTQERSVNYAHLTPGAYCFLVRAINQDGALSVAPASFAFRILPPLWQSWWFIALVLITTVVLVYIAYRYRLAQLLAVERVRTRLATDLHDDIGASLSQIAILSEVVKRRLGEPPVVAEPLALIGQVSREMLDAMNDIVWANNPHYDRLSDLQQRLRHFASELLDARGLAFDLRLPDEGVDLKLDGELRQQAFLIFKEAVNNLARHSGATHAQIELLIEAHCLALHVADNGCGFVPSETNGGNGLRSMQARARELGGELEIVSTPGCGTQINLRVPLQTRWKKSYLNRRGGRWRR